MSQKLFIAFALAFLASSAVQAKPTITTATGWEKSEVVNQEGVYFAVGVTKENLRGTVSLMLDSKNGQLNKVQRYGASVNAVIPVGKFEVTPGIGFDHYEQINKNKLNGNIGIDFYVTPKVAIGAAVKHSDEVSYQAGLTAKW